MPVLQTSPISPRAKPIAPMLATLADRLPRDQQNFAFEFKWDGVRAIVDCAANRIFSRNLLNVTDRYPEFEPLMRKLARKRATIDGEIIALGDDGRPSFMKLQTRMHRVSGICEAQKATPAQLLVFDLLRINGKDLMHEPWQTRRARLEEIIEKGPAWELSPAFVGEGDTILQAARDLHLEGIVAKRIGSRYQPGRRSPDWLKIKLVMRDEYVIGGWIPESGNNLNRVGALLIGRFNSDGALAYAGGVGTGFDNATHDRLIKLLHPRRQMTNPFNVRPPRAGVIFVKPDLVIDVEYRRITDKGILQQAAFKGLRLDKNAQEVLTTLKE